jgi:lysozyme
LKHPTLLLLVILAGCSRAHAPEEGDPGAGDEALRQCPGKDRVRGIDVSYYQGRIDWPSVKAHGVAFGFARVADGAGFVDPAFADNWAGMKAAGVIRGSYQFFRPAEDPSAQAATFVREVRARGGLGPGDLPPALDIEVDGGLPAAALRARAGTWLAEVEAALGRTPIVYTSPGFWAQLEADATFGRYTLWLAHWDTPCPALPGSWDRWRFWQDATDRIVQGIAEPADTDWFDGSRAELEAFAREERRPPLLAEPEPAPVVPRARVSPAGGGRRRHSRGHGRGPRRFGLGRLLRILPF